MSEEGARQFLELAPHAEYLDVDGAGHMVAGDRNDLFNDGIVTFLEKLRAGEAIIDLRVEVRDHIATVTLDRPPVNAITRATMAEIREAFSGLSEQRDVRVAIFTAVGERAFMAGVDLKSVGWGTVPR